MSLRRSEDGLSFTSDTLVEWRGGDGMAAPDQLSTLDRGREGAFSSLRSPRAWIPQGATVLELVVEAAVDSDVEHLFFDDLREVCIIKHQTTGMSNSGQNKG